MFCFGFWLWLVWVCALSCLLRFATVRRQQRLLRRLRNATELLARVLPAALPDATPSSAQDGAGGVDSLGPRDVVNTLLVRPAVALARAVASEATAGAHGGCLVPLQAALRRVARWQAWLLCLRRLCSRATCLSTGRDLPVTATAASDDTGGDMMHTTPHTEEAAPGDGGGGGGGGPEVALAAAAWNQCDVRTRRRVAVSVVGHPDTWPRLVDAALGLLRLQTRVAPTLYTSKRPDAFTTGATTGAAAPLLMDGHQPHSFVRALANEGVRVVDLEQVPDMMHSVGVDGVEVITECLQSVVSEVRVDACGAWVGSVCPVRLALL